MSDSGGRFVWYELATTDIETSKAFYTGVMGWGTDTSMPGANYIQFAAAGMPVAGLMKLPPDAARAGAAPQWLGFVGVDDVDVAASRAVQLGGAVHVPPTDVPNLTRFSVVADPELAPLALVGRPERGQERSAHPSAPGHVGWHELLASDVEKAFAFHSELLGWQKTDIPAGLNGAYLQFSAGAQQIGGIFTRSELSPSSIWLYYFNVKDIVAAAQRVTDSGGQILYGPFVVQGDARVVHCTDPQGALFALIDRPVRVIVGCYSPRDSSHRPGRTQPL